MCCAYNFTPTAEKLKIKVSFAFIFTFQCCITPLNLLVSYATYVILSYKVIYSAFNLYLHVKAPTQQ